MRRRLAPLAMLLLWLGLAPALAQDAGDVTIVDELIAKPLTPGPAWWRVSDRDTTIYVVVVPAYAPRSLAWDQTVLERRMAGASRLILPIRISLNPASLSRMITAAPGMMSDEPLETTLPPTVLEKFVALRTTLGKPAKDYEMWAADTAGTQLEADYRAYRGLIRDSILGAFQASAKRHRVRTVFAATAPVSSIRMQPKAPQAGVACLEARIDTMPARAAALRAAAQAWSQGDVVPLVRPSRAMRLPDLCGDGPIRNGDQIRAKVLAEHVRTFEGALRIKGHSVAVIGAEVLLTRNGLLEQLKAKGYRITTPAVLDD